MIGLVVRQDEVRRQHFIVAVVAGRARVWDGMIVAGAQAEELGSGSISSIK
jgi:hypothetical protein